jgi:hypothetical protein
MKRKNPWKNALAYYSTGCCKFLFWEWTRVDDIFYAFVLNLNIGIWTFQFVKTIVNDLILFYMLRNTQTSAVAELFVCLKGVYTNVIFSVGCDSHIQHCTKN